MDIKVGRYYAWYNTANEFCCAFKILKVTKRRIKVDIIKSVMDKGTTKNILESRSGWLIKYCDVVPELKVRLLYE